MNSIFSFTVVLLLCLVGCTRTQIVLPTNGTKELAATPSPALTPTPEPRPTPNPEMRLTSGLKLVPKTISLENEQRRYKINVTFPQVEGTKHPAFVKLNRHIQNLVTKQYAWPLIAPTKEDLRYYEKWPGVYNSVDLDYYVTLATDRFLSIYLEFYHYGIGAAHSVEESFAVNFDMTTKTLLTVESLFKPGTQPLQLLSKYCIRQLSKGHSWAMNDSSFRRELSPARKNFASWNIVPGGIRINFDACKIDGCAAGAVKILVPFAELKPLMRSEFAGAAK